MSEILKSIGESVQGIANIHSLIAFVVVVVLFFIIKPKDLGAKQRIGLLCIFLIWGIALVWISKPNQKEALPQKVSPIEVVDDKEKILFGIKTLIDSSTLPLYLTDKNLKVMYCNTRLANLMDYNKEDIVGKPIEKLRPIFSLRVHKQVRAKFDREQDFLMGENRRKTPLVAEYETIIDNRELHGKPYGNLYRLLIHYDMITYGPDSKILGAFVNFDLDELDEGDLPQAIDEVLKKKYIDE